MKIFQIHIKHVYAYNFASMAICINWGMIVDVDFGALYFCGTMGANLAKLNFWHFWPFSTFLDLASLGLQKCYAPKFTSIIILQLIQMVTWANF